MNQSNYSKSSRQASIIPMHKLLWVGNGYGGEGFLQAVTIYDREGRVCGGDTAMLLTNHEVVSLLHDAVVNYYSKPPQNSDSWRTLNWQESWAFAVLLNQAPFPLYDDALERLKKIRQGDDPTLYSIIGDIEQPGVLNNETI